MKTRYLTLLSIFGLFGLFGCSDEPAGPCDGTIPDTLSYTLTLEHGGAQRSALVYLPKTYDGKTPTALVLNYHGLGSNAGEQAYYSAMEYRAEDRGMISVHPEGLPNSQGQQSWNGGICCQDNDVDDVAFTAALLDSLSASVCVDTKRVYATGMSNGGIMSYQLGCSLSDRIAAIAPVAGLNVTTTCEPAQGISLMHFHGTADATVPYVGDPQYNIPGALEGVTQWAADYQSCTDAPKQTYVNGEVSCDTISCTPDRESTLCTVTGGGHTWPGAIDVPSLGYTTKDIDATDAMLSFFEAAL